MQERTSMHAWEQWEGEFQQLRQGKDVELTDGDSRWNKKFKTTVNDTLIESASHKN